MKARMLSVATVVSMLILLAATARADDARRPVPQELFAQATAHGSARVIVRLNAPFSPGAELLSGAHAAAQRQGIAAVRGALETQLAGVRHRIVREFGALPLLVLEAGPDALARLHALPGLVVSVEEDSLSRPQLAESTSVVQAPAAWAAGFDGTGAIVALLDTGVEKTHPFLSGKVIAEACFSTNTTYEGHTVTSLCPGGATSATGPDSALNCDAAIFNCDNGTHVAGVVAGGTTDVSPAGVAPGASLMSIQVYSRFPGAYAGCGGVDCTLSFASDQIAALNYVFEQRNAFAGKTIAAANMGLGGGAFSSPCDFDPIVAPIAQLRTVGIATVISTANDGLTDAMGSPACAPGAVSVGATNDGSFGTTLDAVSYYSNMASFMSLLAPGSWVRSSVPTTTDPSGFAVFGGTSVSTAHVSGAFAILRAGNPTASVDTLLEALQSTGLAVTDDRPVCATCSTTGVTSHRIAIKAALDVVAADVAVTAASTVAAAAPGQAIVVNATVSNEGGLTVGPFAVRYFLSRNAVFNEGVDVLVGSRSVTSLDPGATNVTPKTVTIPMGTATGSYRILVVADAGNVVAESDESNNVRATAPLVVGLDVAVTTASTVSLAAPGEAIVVQSTIENTGSVAADAFAVRYYLSTNSAYDGGDVLVGSRRVTSLAVGAQDVTPKTLTVPIGTAPGTYRVLVQADAAGVLTEASESNNVKATAAIVVGPDVTVISPTTVATAAPGDAIVVNATVRNTGSVAAGPFAVRYFLSTDSLFDGADVLVGSRSVTSLAAGEDNVTPKTVTIPPATSPGTYRVLVVADPAGVVAEANENNNARAAAAITIGP